jgi:hypothetical protein
VGHGVSLSRPDNDPRQLSNDRLRGGITQDMKRPRVVAALIALLASPLVLIGGTPAQAVPVASYRFLPARVFGTVAVGMPDPRTVQVQHLDPATGSWDAPATIYHARGRVTCGAIDGRASSPTGPGVVLLLECDKPYYDDQAPAHSVAVVSRDGRSWSHRKLPGEAYRDPAISPSATYAAWLAGPSGGYVEWSAASGFGRPARTSYRYDQGMETPVVDDTGTVTVVGPEVSPGGCVVGIHARTLSGVPSHTTLPVDPGCTEGDFENVDALTVLGGGTERATQFTVARGAVGAAWGVTRVAPADAPGLERWGTNPKRIQTHYVYSTRPGSTIVAVGSEERHHVMAQVFDQDSWTWSPPTELYAATRRCDEGYFDQPASALYVDVLKCGIGYVALVSADGTSWTVRDIHRNPFAVTDRGVALPGRAATTVVRPDGVQEFPVAADGPCDVLVPGRAGELVRLHGRRGSWPTRVQVSTGGRFHTVSRARRVADVCRGALVHPGYVSLDGRHTARDGQFVLRGGTWRFVYLRADS